MATSGRKASQSSGPKRGGSKEGTTGEGIGSEKGGDNRDGGPTIDGDEETRINMGIILKFIINLSIILLFTKNCSYWQI